MTDIAPHASNSMEALTFAYYCSGHGYGHATRVSAFTAHLLSLSPKPTVHIVSSAPEHVFSNSIALGAFYRNAHIDPVIVQPLAYRVDRAKSVKALRHFLQGKHEMIEEEAEWLRLINADCVLSDAAFLGCAAANTAGRPSVLVTNFTFDSVFSYLSTALVDRSRSSQERLRQAGHPFNTELPPDVPIPPDDIAPLVDEVLLGYRCADLLLRLPGSIPIPSFFSLPTLPSPAWIDPRTRTFAPDIITHLTQDPSELALLTQIPFPNEYPPKTVPRRALSAPLLVRSPNPSIYTLEGRNRLLEAIGIPSHLRHLGDTKILIVSFGGQIFHKPRSRTHSRTISRSGTPHHPVLAPSKIVNVAESSRVENALGSKSSLPADSDKGAEVISNAPRESLIAPRNSKPTLSRIVCEGTRTQSLLMVPGAPPASIPTSPNTSTLPVFNTIVIPPTPRLEETDAFQVVAEPEELEEPSILPDSSWIAVVCGVPKDWAREDGSELPESFFVAPKDVYMPDLTAVADVLLGKLGYGTVSECVDACTPFVYVPRPLFIEEHGLRLFLDQEGVGVELSQDAYEAGDWAGTVQEAYDKGKMMKAEKRQRGETGQLAAAGREMAATVARWAESWKQ